MGLFDSVIYLGVDDESVYGAHKKTDMNVPPDTTPIPPAQPPQPTLSDDVEPPKPTEVLAPTPPPAEIPPEEVLADPEGDLEGDEDGNVDPERGGAGDNNDDIDNGKNRKKKN